MAPVSDIIFVAITITEYKNEKNLSTQKTPDAQSSRLYGQNVQQRRTESVICQKTKGQMGFDGLSIPKGCIFRSLAPFNA